MCSSDLLITEEVKYADKMFGGFINGKIMDSALVAMAMMNGLTSAIVNPNDLRLMETIKSCDVFKGNTLYADSYLEI